MRNGDIVSRWDKDEFIFLVSKVQDTSSLLGIAQRLMKPVLAPVTAGEDRSSQRLPTGWPSIRWMGSR
ncbi:GGDEF domain-containing protein [Synechocystis sp. B12]|nr:GGDEF domain-containing protein [Synechocystis sp. B12]